MKRFALLLCFLSLALTVRAADLPADTGLAEVRDLGRLNGQALACGYTDAAGQIKKEIIKSAPKSRRYGAAFEEATNDAFLAQSRQEQTACPDGPTLGNQVEEAIRRLQAALPGTAAN